MMGENAPRQALVDLIIEHADVAATREIAASPRDQTHALKTVLRSYDRLDRQIKDTLFTGLRIHTQARFGLLEDLRGIEEKDPNLNCERIRTIRAISGERVPMAAVPALQERLIFFFQAEDGIRDGTVTGVQTCALPI